MQTRSSPSLPPRKPRNLQTRLGVRSLSPSEKHLQTPPLVVQRRRTEIAKIDDPAKRRVTFSKRRKGLFKKASDLCELTGARAAIIVVSNTGKAYTFGSPNVEEIISDYFCRNGNVMPPKSLRDWVEKERDSGVGVGRDYEVSHDDDKIHSLSESFEAPCPSRLAPFEDLAGDGDRGGFLTSPVNSATEEDFDSRIVDDVGADGDSGAGVCCDSEVLNDDEIDSLVQNLKASRPSLFALFKDYVRHGDCDSFSTSPVNLATGGGSSGVESTPVRSVLEGCAYNGASDG